MPNTLKSSAVLWALAGLLAPFVLLPVLYKLGISVSAYHIWVLSLPLCGYKAYSSYKQGTRSPSVAGAPPNVTVQPVAMSGQAKLGLAVVGAALGFGVGYLTRPTFLGQKMPLQVLFEKAPAEFAQLKSEYVMHMTVATVIGLAAAMALAFAIGAARKA